MVRNFKNLDPRQIGSDVLPSMSEARALLGIGIVGLPFLLGIMVIIFYWGFFRGFDEEMLIFLALLGFFCGLLTVFVWSSRDYFRTARESELEGIVVPGVIMDKWTTVEEDAVYCYSAAYQVSYKDNIWVGRHSWYGDWTPLPFDKLQIGDRVFVRFLPRHPEFSMMQEN